MWGSEVADKKPKKKKKNGFDVFNTIFPIYILIRPVIKGCVVTAH